jgi:hypothetical protein
MPFWKRKRDLEIRPSTARDWTGGHHGSIQNASESTKHTESIKAASGQSQASLAIKPLDTERLGLFVLANQDENDPEAIDIVAIHGLNGHWENTWRTTTQNGGGVNWLREFLPQQVPRARVMSFGYDSVLQFSKSVADIGTFAEQLLEDLISRRAGPATRRPIIFICHSLGGIVVKKVSETSCYVLFSDCPRLFLPSLGYCQSA